MNFFPMLETKGSPFGLPIVSTEFTSRKDRIRGFGGLKTPLVRVGRTPYVGTIAEKSELRSKYRHASRLFDELEIDFGILVPRHQNVVGLGESVFGGEISPQIFTVVERVQGDDIEMLFYASNEERARVHPLVDDLYKRLFAYLAAKYQRGGYYLNDLKNEQFVISNLPGNQEGRVYFVDLDPEFSFFDSLDFKAPGTNHFFEMMLTRIVSELTTVEYMFEQGPLTEARRAGLVFLESLPLDIPYYEARVERLIQVLEQKELKEA